MATKIESIGRLRIGQRVRYTERRLLTGKHVLDDASWVNDVTTGVISAFKRTDGGAMVFLDPTETGLPLCFHLGISPLGPLMNHHGRRVEIIDEAPDQGRLFRKG